MENKVFNKDMLYKYYKWFSRKNYKVDKWFKNIYFAFLISLANMQKNIVFYSANKKIN